MKAIQILYAIGGHLLCSLGVHRRECGGRAGPDGGARYQCGFCYKDMGDGPLGFSMWRPRISFIAWPLFMVLMTGCATARFGGHPLVGPTGCDGAMLTLRVGAQPCAPVPVPASDPANPPGTAVGRAMVRAADWTVEHPGWAAVIAAGTAAVAAGAANDWWGLFDGDSGDDSPKTDPAPDSGTDREVDARIAGNGNAVNVSYTYLPGGGKMPNVAADVNGDNNKVNIDVKPME